MIHALTIEQRKSNIEHSQFTMSSHTSTSIFPQEQVLDGPCYPHCHPKPKTMATKRLRICMVVSSLFLIIVVTMLLTLILTIFKPKDPDISVHPVDLENFELFQPSVTKVPLGLVITIVNPNHGSFKYINSTGYLIYHDTIVAEVPLVTKFVPARSTINVSTFAGVMTRQLESDPKFWSDIEVGTLNFTSKATLPGKVTMLKIFKLKATVYITCDISFKLNISSMDADSSCISKIKL